MSKYTGYLSPFSWRYASEEMRTLWSEHERRSTWRRIWVALARAQLTFGLVNQGQVDELQAAVQRIDIPRALEIEAEIHHDLMAEVRTYAEQCPNAGGIIHLGATSMDIEDNADALRIRTALRQVISRLVDLLQVLAGHIQTHAATPMMAFTHLQPAEPTTLGYRLSFYAQDLAADLQDLLRLHGEIKGKGFKGAVGTAASYGELFGLENYPAFEQHMSQLLDLPFYDVTSQTYPRRQDYQVLSALAGLGASLYKFAFDLRILQSPVIGEWSEPFGQHQVGSSAMPFKRNPIQTEKIDSLARLLSTFPQVAWHNAAHSLLERTLDDSANRRTIIPEAFLITDELLRVATRVIKGLKVNQSAIQRNLDVYAPFASTERLLMALVKAGASRQEMHERLREHAMNAWQAVQAGQANPLIDQIGRDSAFLGYLDSGKMMDCLNAQDYTGIAESQSRCTVERISNLIKTVK